MHRGGRRFDPDTLHTKAPDAAFFMNFSVYIIYSALLDKYHTGICQDFGIRLLEHNAVKI